MIAFRRPILAITVKTSLSSAAVSSPFKHGLSQEQAHVISSTFTYQINWSRDAMINAELESTPFTRL